MKKHNFTIHITFEDSINDDNEIKEIAENIAKALKNASNNFDIAPEDSETSVIEIGVSNCGIEMTTINLIK